VLGILRRDGALAERVAVPLRCLVEVPDSLPDDRAVFAEPVAAALHVLDDATDPGPVAVLGDGKLGLLIALALRSADREVVVVGHHEEKLAIARASGATGVLERDVDATPRRVPTVVEATGSAGGLETALRLVRPRGTVILKTTVAGQTAIDLSPVVVNEVRVMGSRCGDMRRAVHVLASGRLDPSPLVVARYALEDAEAALVHAARKGTLKVLVAG
jgi:threonine dehydrogenase-like Zn-dependent dehydrogenase